MAAAPDLLALYAFEKQIEPAAVAVLTTLEVPACRQRGPGSLITPRVEVRMVLGVPTGHKKVMPGATLSPSQTVPDAWHAQLVLTTITNRKEGVTNDGRHDELLTKCRVMMLQAAGYLNAQLTWLCINVISDAGMIPAVHENSDLDVSPAVYNLQFGIRADAWPTGE